LCAEAAVVVVGRRGPVDVFNTGWHQKGHLAIELCTIYSPQRMYFLPLFFLCRHPFSCMRQLDGVEEVWRRRCKGEPANLGSPGKKAIKLEYVIVC